MTKRDRLVSEIKRLQDQWNVLSDKLGRMEQQLILETRVDEKMRLEALIRQTREKRQEIEQNLNALEEQMQKTDSQAPAQALIIVWSTSLSKASEDRSLTTVARFG